MPSSNVINIESNEDASYEKAYQHYIDSLPVICRVIFNMRNLDITVKQSKMLFGRVLVNDAYSKVELLNCKDSNINNICKGIKKAFAKRYPDGIKTDDGEIVTTPEIVVEHKGKITKYLIFSFNLEVYLAVLMDATSH